MDRFTLVPHIKSSEEKRTDHSTGDLEVAAVTSRLEVLDV